MARFTTLRYPFDETIRVRLTTTGLPALDTAPDDEVVAFVKSLTGANATTKISFGTEGGLYQQRLGVPTVVCGPGSIAVAHKPDEYVEAAQLDACSAFLSRLVGRLAARLELAMRAGELRRDDPEFAAELLLGMLVGQDRLKRLFGVAPAKAKGRAEAIVDCFLRAFAP